MTNPAAPTNTRIDRLTQTVLFPVKVASFPFLYLANRVQKVVSLSFGYLARIGVFSFGEWNRSQVKRQIIEMYKGGWLDPQKRMKFDPFRLEQAFAVLENVGGVRFPVYTRDGIQLDSMLLRYGDVKKKIEEHGGQIIKCMPVTIQETIQEGKERTYHCRAGHVTTGTHEYVDIIMPKGDSNLWGDFFQKNLLSIGLENGIIQMPDGSTVEGLIIKHWNSPNPKRPNPGKCFLRSNSPTESFPMAKRDILRRILGTEGDCLAFDYRGTWQSGGVPSEGGYYLDAEAIFEKAIYEYGYDPLNLWVDGFCLGGAVAIHLFRKYHDLGINIFVQNTFNSMLGTFRTQLFPGNVLGPIGLDSVRSWDPKVYSRTEEDSFDSLGKLESLRGQPKKGTAIIINTDTDATVPKNAHYLIATAMSQVAKKCSSIFYRHPVRNRDGHGADILSDPELWNKAVALIAESDPPQKSWFSFSLGG